MHHNHSTSDDLQRLVDEDKLDELLAEVGLAGVADAWRCYHERAKAGAYVDHTDPDWWAVEFWLGMGFQREEVAQSGLLALVEAVDDELLPYVGAGPLECFICPVESRIRWFEKTAEASPQFRTALAAVYAWGSEEDWVSERLERAAGVPLLRPR